MKARWYKTKVAMPFFAGACFSAQHYESKEDEKRKISDKVKIMAVLGKDGCDSKYVIISQDEFKQRLDNKTIVVKSALILKEQLETEKLWEKAKNVTEEFPTFGEAKWSPAMLHQAQGRITRPQMPQEVKIAQEISYDQVLTRVKQQAALLNKPQ